jgi:hypothetical protein
MKQQLAQLRQSRLARFFARLHTKGEEGMAIAEYAVGILLVAGFGLVIFAIIKSDKFFDVILDLVMGLVGVIAGLF